MFAYTVLRNSDGSASPKVLSVLSSGRTSRIHLSIPAFCNLTESCVCAIICPVIFLIDAPASFADFLNISLYLSYTLATCIASGFLVLPGSKSSRPISSSNLSDLNNLKIPSWSFSSSTCKSPKVFASIDLPSASADS